MSFRSGTEISDATLLIRADGGPRLGSGHVMRCLALAQAWLGLGGTATFLSCCENPGLRQRIESAGVGFVPLDAPHPHSRDLSATRAAGASWIVLDGYHFGPAYQEALRMAGHRLLVIDDYAHLPRYHADVLLNQNIAAPSLTYACDTATVRLLGIEYALLRPEFLAWGDWRRSVPEQARRVLVTMGGADPENVTLKIIHALWQLRLPSMEVKIVVGPANPHLEALRAATRAARHPMELMTDVADMPPLMAWADVALSAGGSTCWELAFMGLPSFLLTLAENQAGIPRALDARGAAIDLGWHTQVSEAGVATALAELIHDPARRREMIERGREIIDGAGAGRVAAILRGAL
jgi:UDP-2,4-diacetamido-2,4,6-trideoxy-beta-L-altropyranose hydrolase